MGTALRLAMAACLGVAGGVLPMRGALAGIPEQVGACVATSIIQIGTHQLAAEAPMPVRFRPVKAPARSAGRGTATAPVLMPASAPALTLSPRLGHVVGYANASSQVSFLQLPEITRSLLDDRVQMCLVSSAACPRGAAAGRTYRVTNQRTRESWTLPDADRVCAAP